MFVGVASTDISSNVSHQVCHCLAFMIASDVGMNVLPSSLDSVVIWTVWRQKVENQSTALRCVQAGLYQWGRVNREVIQNDMDLPGLRITKTLP